MLLSARILTNVNSVNDFGYDSEFRFFEGDGPSVFIQLIDASRDRSSDGFSPTGRRYMPASGATLQVTFDNIDDLKKVTKFAVQPYAQDPSIWRVDLLATDPIRGTPTMRLALTEGVVVRQAALPNVVKAVTQSNIQ